MGSLLRQSQRPAGTWVNYDGRITNLSDLPVCRDGGYQKFCNWVAAIVLKRRILPIQSRQTITQSSYSSLKSVARPEPLDAAVQTVKRLLEQDAFAESGDAVTDNSSLCPEKPVRRSERGPGNAVQSLSSSMACHGACRS